MGLIDVSDVDGVRTVAMVDRAGANALDGAMARALEEALAVPEGVRVVVLRGLDDVFCSGASPAVIEGLGRGEIDPGELVLPRAVLGAAVPVIAAMEGHAIGGGFVLGLCADIVLISQEARYGATFMSLGFTPGMGATRLLERVMSPAQAHEMLLTGEPRRGRDLVGHGFNHVLPRAEVWPRAMELALRLADEPREALTMLKQALSARWLRHFEAAHTVERSMHARCFAAIREGRDA
ncbi:MAG: enoyl-CoA hydratase/isomerase family protein [Alphaproteobacteria bacterium]|nr:enoyl-CoA hydratase/isomerase family protein [Alphaproteobacteria bacterium]